MAFTTVVTHATGDVLPASDWNTYVRDNLAYLHGDAGTVQLTNALSTGLASEAVGGAQGIFVGANGQLWVSNTAATTALAITVPGDASATRFEISSSGSMTWGTGASGRDVTLARVAAGVLQLGTTAQAGAFRVIQAAAGNTIFQGYVTTDANPRIQINADGTINWGPATTGTDTSINRAAVGVLDVNNTIVEGYVTTGATGLPATFSVPVANGPYQRFNASSTGTLTIGSPGTPPAGTSMLLTLIVHNGAGSAITLSWNAIYEGASPTALPTSVGAGVTANVLLVYDPTEAKWNLLAYNT